jgi:glycosyltransferase involved in cell wall biosynthesis
VPGVSVIVAVHNAERYLRQCLDSLTNQTLTDVEILCVDDGSTDSSRAILEEYAAAHPQFRVIDGPAVGSAGAARNTGMDVATGDYLSFLDADDFFDPSMLAELHQQAVRDKADAVIAKFRVFDERTQDSTAVQWPLQLQYFPTARPFPATDVGDPLFLAVNPAAWNKLFRADYVRGLGLRFQHLKRTNDAYFTYMALAHAERLSYVNRYVLSYRTGNASSLQGTVHQTPLDFVDALAAMRDKLKETGRYSTFERAWVNLALDFCVSNLRRANNPQTYLELHKVLTEEVLARFDILGRPAGYFIRKNTEQELADLLSMTPLEFLFKRLQTTAEAANKAQSEVRAALREARLMAIRPTLPASAPTESSRPETAQGPDLTVIIPAYNTQTFIAECVASVQAQTGASLQIVCIDDGSTDATPEILDALAAQDERIEVVHQENGGLSVARNVGLDRATGRYVCFLDSDDLWRIDGIAEAIRMADADAVDVLMFDAVPFRDAGVDDKTWALFVDYYHRSDRFGEVVSGPELLAKMNPSEEYLPNAALYLFRRAVAEDAGLRFYPGLTHEDNLFTFSLMLAAGRARHTQLDLHGRRVRPGSIMTSGSRVASARGFYICCYEMLRLTSTARHADWVDVQLGQVIYSMFRHSREHFIKLDPDTAERFASIDSSPDARAIYLLLRRAHYEAQFKRAPVRKPTTTVGKARRLAGRAKRFALRKLASARSRN